MLGRRGVTSHRSLCAPQILPINDTSVRDTWQDSYPYRCACEARSSLSLACWRSTVRFSADAASSGSSSLSVYALHPMYIHLDRLTTDKSLLAEIAAQQSKLNALSKIDYEVLDAHIHHSSSCCDLTSLPAN